MSQRNTGRQGGKDKGSDNKGTGEVNSTEKSNPQQKQQSVGDQLRETAHKRQTTQSIYPQHDNPKKEDNRNTEATRSVPTARSSQKVSARNTASQIPQSGQKTSKDQTQKKAETAKPRQTSDLEQIHEASHGGQQSASTARDQQQVSATAVHSTPTNTKLFRSVRNDSTDVFKKGTVVQPGAIPPIDTSSSRSAKNITTRAPDPYTPDATVTQTSQSSSRDAGDTSTGQASKATAKVGNSRSTASTLAHRSKKEWGHRPTSTQPLPNPPPPGHTGRVQPASPNRATSTRDEHAERVGSGAGWGNQRAPAAPRNSANAFSQSQTQSSMTESSDETFIQLDNLASHFEDVTVGQGQGGIMVSWELMCSAQWARAAAAQNNRPDGGPGLLRGNTTRFGGQHNLIHQVMPVLSLASGRDQSGGDGISYDNSRSRMIRRPGTGQGPGWRRISLNNYFSLLQSGSERLYAFGIQDPHNALAYWIQQFESPLIFDFSGSQRDDNIILFPMNYVELLAAREMVLRAVLPDYDNAVGTLAFYQEGWLLVYEWWRYGDHSSIDESLAARYRRLLFLQSDPH